MTEAEKEAKKQIELEDKIRARFYIRRLTWRSMASRRIVLCAGPRCVGTTMQKRTELRRARLFEVMADDERS